jgi:hypothetical protein
MAVTIRVLKGEKVNGTRLRPGDIREIPDWAVDPLVKRGSVEVVDTPVVTNENVDRILTNAPEGARMLIKLPETENNDVGGE